MVRAGQADHQGAVGGLRHRPAGRPGDGDGQRAALPGRLDGLRDALRAAGCRDRDDQRASRGRRAQPRRAVSRNRRALSGSQETPASDSNAISAAQAAW